MVGNGRSRELCEALELARCTLQADHLRFLSNSQARAIAATIITPPISHEVDADGSSIVCAGLDSGAFDCGDDGVSPSPF